MGSYTSSSSEETQQLGAVFAQKLSGGMIIALEGDLGSGKTELVRGVMHALNSAVCVHSPSYSLVNTYVAGDLVVHHFDFYRLNSVDELFEIGFEEYITDDAVLFIEWASLFPKVLPSTTKLVTFSTTSENGRKIISEVPFLSE